MGDGGERDRKKIVGRRKRRRGKGKGREREEEKKMDLIGMVGGKRTLIEEEK